MVCPPCLVSCTPSAPLCTQFIFFLKVENKKYEKSHFIGDNLLFSALIGRTAVLGPCEEFESESSEEHA
jgi:hypothetical protein